MYRLYGIPTQNTLKVAYVLDAVGVEYEFQFINLAKGEQKTEAFLKINPIGKVPALKHNDTCLFESNSICRYIARVEKSSLYPNDLLTKTQNDQWLDFFSNHLGRWLSTLFFEKCLKPQMGVGEPNISKCDEALNFINQQFPPIEKHLKEVKFFGGSQLSITDFVAFAYLEQTIPLKFDMTLYPKTHDWLKHMGLLESIKKTKTKVKF